MSRLNESDGVTTADGHGDSEEEWALRDPGFRQFQFIATTWLLDNESFPTVAENCLLSLLLAPSAQSSPFCSPNPSCAFVLPHTLKK